MLDETKQQYKNTEQILIDLNANKKKLKMKFNP